MSDNIYTNTMLGTFSIYHERSSNLSSEINIGYLATAPNLNSSITIKARNEMYGKFLVKTPTRQTVYLLPIQDAFVRKNAPTMNYPVGEVDVGSDNFTGDVFRGFFKWDLSELNGTNFVITKAIIHFKLLQTGSYNFNINNVLSAWSEYGVTWKGQPAKGTLISNIISEDNVSEILVDILDTARNWYTNQNTNYGIELSAVDETLNSIMRLGGRETTGLETSLEVQYFDPNGVYDEENDLNSSIIIQKQNNLDLNSSIQIKNTFIESNINGSIQIRIPETLFSQITINKENLPSNISISNIFNLPSNVSITRLDSSELDSNIIINNDLHSQIKISNSSNLNSNIIIKKEDLNGNIIISGSKSLDGNIIISNSSNLNSGITIQNPQITGNINISANSNLFGAMTIRKVLWMNSNIKISNNYNLPSSIQIGTHENLNSSIEISNGINTNNLDGTIQIRKQEEKNLNGSITIQKVKQISGNITIRSDNLGYGHITIMRQESNNLPSTLTVHDRYPKINGSIDIRAPWYSDLESNIIIRNGNETDDDNTGYIM